MVINDTSLKHRLAGNFGQRICFQSPGYLSRVEVRTNRCESLGILSVLLINSSNVSSDGERSASLSSNIAVKSLEKYWSDSRT